MSQEKGKCGRKLVKGGEQKENEEQQQQQQQDWGKRMRRSRRSKVKEVYKKERGRREVKPNTKWENFSALKMEILALIWAPLCFTVESNQLSEGPPGTTKLCENDDSKFWDSNMAYIRDMQYCLQREICNCYLHLLRWSYTLLASQP